MTGPEHYREAERLLEQAAGLTATAYEGDELAAAQVHATLALAAATAYPAIQDYWGADDANAGRDWAGVAS